MRLMLLFAPLCLATTPAAAAPIRYVAAGAERVDGSRRLAIDVVALNSDDAASTLSPPSSLDGTLTVGGADYPVRLESAAEGRITIRPGGFAQLRYLLAFQGPLPPAGVGTLTVPALGISDAGLAIAGPRMAARADAVPESAPASVARGNAFTGNLSAYRPIYAVYGPGTNSDARLQISFQYQLFGDPATPPAERGPLDNLRFAYTQRMFWDLAAKSSPFRNIDYMPELFYLIPERKLGGGALLGGQAGFMHQSNGRSGDASRSLNMLYVQPTATVTTGRYRISAGPRGWLYVGSLSDNPDMRRYRGNLGLDVHIDRDDGLRLSASSRSSVQTGRTSVDAELSYALNAILGGGPNLYLFGQGFAGWGENLLDYRTRQTRLRIGVGIIR